jgi:hypothetical protein
MGIRALLMQLFKQYRMLNSFVLFSGLSENLIEFLIFF